MSLVELMVGITIGLFIVAAAALMVGNQLTDNRKLLLETQLQQDMRATMDIMTRQIRRAGALELGLSQSLMATDDGVQGSRNLGLTQIDLVNTDDLRVSYFLNLADQNFGYQLQSGVVKAMVGASGWQELTDPNAVNVTRLRFDPIAARESSVIPCPKLCPGGTRTCWPTVQVRGFTVVLEAEARNDSRVRRRMETEVRVRNDFLKFNTGIPTQACPS
jgi:type II secretory pathway component PulJ